MRRVVLLLGLSSALALPSVVRAEDWNRAYAVGAHPRLEIVTDDGHVRVASGDTKEIVFKVHTTGWRIAPNAVRIDAHQDAGGVHFECHLPTFHYYQIGMTFFRKIEIDAIVPRELDLDIRTGDGSVTLPPLAGAIHVHTADGAIEAEGLHGDLRLESSDGHIRATDLDGDLYAHTSDGSVTVSGRFARLQLSSGDGRIVAELSDGSRVTDEWSVRTSDGGIRFQVPRGFAADLEADTGDGSIDVDLPIAVDGRMESHHIRGRVNGGGGRVTLHSGDGSIRIVGM